MQLRCLKEATFTKYTKTIKSKCRLGQNCWCKIVYSQKCNHKQKNSLFNGNWRHAIAQGLP